MATLYMNPVPIRTAASRALISSGMKARALAQSKNPSPRMIGVDGPRLLKSYGYEAAMLRGTGLAATFEEGRKGGYIITPGLRQGSRSKYQKVTVEGSFLYKYKLTQRQFFVGPSYSASRQAKGGSSIDAIKFPPGDPRGRFYRGIGFKGGAMRAKPFLGPTLPPWMAWYNADLSMAMATQAKTEMVKIGNLAGFRL